MRHASGELSFKPVDRLVQALVLARHVQHSNPDAIAVLCCAANGEQLSQTCFGEEVAWIPSGQSTTTLVRRLAEVTRKPELRLLLLAGDGLLTWGETAEECRTAAAEASARAADFVTARMWGMRYGGPAIAALDVERRTTLLAGLLPLLRAALSSGQPKMIELDTSDMVLEFVCSRDAPLLAEAGPLLREPSAPAGQVPLWVDFDPLNDDETALAERTWRGVERFRRGEREADSTRVDPDAHIVLIAGVGMVTAGSTAAAARRTRDLYVRTIDVLGSVTTIDRLAPLTVLKAPSTESSELHVVSHP